MAVPQLGLDAQRASLYVDRALHEPQQVAFEGPKASSSSSSSGKTSRLRQKALVEGRFSDAATERPPDQPLKLVRSSGATIQVIGCALAAVARGHERVKRSLRHPAGVTESK